MAANDNHFYLLIIKYIPDLILTQVIKRYRLPGDQISWYDMTHSLKTLNMAARIKMAVFCRIFRHFFFIILNLSVSYVLYFTQLHEMFKNNLFCVLFLVYFCPFIAFKEHKIRMIFIGHHQAFLSDQCHVVIKHHFYSFLDYLYSLRFTVKENQLTWELPHVNPKWPPNTVI